jgi:hypothetical protein
VRALLVAVLIHGLAPGFAEAAEALVHYAATGHLAHSPGEQDLGEQGAEHSCGVAFHHCGCCASMGMMPHERSDVACPAPPVDGDARLTLRGHASRPLEPPFRPPIA